MTNQMPKDAAILRAFVAEPAQAWQELREYEKFLANAPKLDWVSVEMNRQLPALVPTDLCMVLGRSGGGKTSLLSAMGAYQARKLQADGRDLDNFVAYFSFDQARQTIERKIDLRMRYDKARATGKPFEQTEITLAERIAFPFWQIGKRAGHRDGIHLPPLTEDMIERILEYIKSYQDQIKKRAALVLIDYVQRIPTTKYSNTTDIVKYVANRLKDFADSEETIVIAGAQAQRDLDDRASIEEMVPKLNDGRNSAAIEDAGDVHIGIAYPKAFKKIGEPVQYAGRTFAVTENLFCGRCNKDRDGRNAGNQFAFYFDPATGQIGDYQ